MRKRHAILVYAEILTVLEEGPSRPTRLARVCNVPYDRLSSYLSPLLAKGFIEQVSEEGHDTYILTRDGSQMLDEMRRVLDKLKP